MTTKEYLQQLHKAEAVISQRVQQKADLRTVLTSIPGMDLSRERVQGGKTQSEKGYAQKVVKLIDLENEIDGRIGDFVDLEHKIIGQIHDLNNADQIRVLYKRYVKFEKFDQIADDLGHSVRNIYFIHDQGLQEFEKMHSDGGYS